jgi:tetrathionate reductase subunit B
MLDRRKAVKLLASSAAVFAFVPATKALESIKSEKGKKHLAMVIDLSRCNGCKACTISCGVENGNKPTEHRTEVVQIGSQIGDKQYVMNLPLLCNNCETPSCVRVCPTKATYKREEDGIVVVDSTICIGCNYCIKGCPYSGARFENSETATVDKCNFCVQRTSKGLLPACVETCLGEARAFGDLNDPKSTVSKLLKENKAMVMQYNKGTTPNVFYIGLSQEASNHPFSIHTDLKWQR